MSPTMSAFGLADATICTWYSMCSIDTPRVVFWPCITVATESPTRIRSTPASSTIDAKVESYAVTIVRGWALFLCSSRCGTMILILAIDNSAISLTHQGYGSTADYSMRAVCHLGEQNANLWLWVMHQLSICIDYEGWAVIAVELAPTWVPVGGECNDL